MTTILLDPTSQLSPGTIPVLPRLSTLAGATIGLLDISKQRGDVFLDRLEALLSNEGVTVKRYKKPTMTRVALPEMIERRYSPDLATGCIAAGGTLGTLIPPSVIMVLYAALTEQFVIALFVAAIVPGLIAVLLHFVAIVIYVSRNPDAGPAGPRVPWRTSAPR